MAKNQGAAQQADQAAFWTQVEGQVEHNPKSYGAAPSRAQQITGSDLGYSSLGPGASSREATHEIEWEDPRYPKVYELQDSAAEMEQALHFSGDWALDQEEQEAREALIRLIQNSPEYHRLRRYNSAKLSKAQADYEKRAALDANLTPTSDEDDEDPEGAKRKVQEVVKNRAELQPATKKSREAVQAELARQLMAQANRATGYTQRSATHEESDRVWNARDAGSSL